MNTHSLFAHTVNTVGTVSFHVFGECAQFFSAFSAIMHSAYTVYLKIYESLQLCKSTQFYSTYLANTRWAFCSGVLFLSAYFRRVHKYILFSEWNYFLQQLLLGHYFKIWSLGGQTNIKQTRYKFVFNSTVAWEKHYFCVFWEFEQWASKSNI